MKKLIKSISLLILAALLLAGLSGCGRKSESDAQLWGSAAYTENTELGDGEKAFTLHVTAGEKSVIFTIHTDKTLLGDALKDNALITGEEGQYGLYIKTVNGIRADYDEDGYYWAFYIGGDYAPSGIDATEITEGAEYSLVREK